MYDIVDGGYLTWLYGSKPFARAGWPPQSVRGAILALDCLDDTFRKRRDPSYKANREGKKFEDRDSYDQFQRIRQLRRDVVEDPRLNCIRVSGLEADDVIALAAWKFALRGDPMRLLAQDKDLLQIKGVVITDNQGEMVDLKRFSARLPKSITTHPLKREHIPLILALMGDKSDNVTRLVGRGDLWIMSKILRAPKVAESYDLAFDNYGRKFLENLFSVVLPDPHIFGFDHQQVMQVLAQGKWGPSLLKELTPEYEKEVKGWRLSI